MDFEMKKLLEEILFQLHVISAQNSTFMANFQTEEGRENLRKLGLDQMVQETLWMTQTVNKKKEWLECRSGSISSSDS